MHIARLSNGALPVCSYALQVGHLVHVRYPHARLNEARVFRTFVALLFSSGKFLIGYIFWFT